MVIALTVFGAFFISLKSFFDTNCKLIIDKRKLIELLMFFCLLIKGAKKMFEMSIQIFYYWHSAPTSIFSTFLVLDLSISSFYLHSARFLSTQIWEICFGKRRSNLESKQKWLIVVKILKKLFTNKICPIFLRLFELS